MRSLARLLARAAAGAALTLAPLGAGLLPAAALAQDGPAPIQPLGPATAHGEPRFMGGLTLSVAQPRGEFHQYVDDGYGIAGHGLYRIGGQGALALRLDGGFVNYGRETKRVPLSSTVGGRIQVDVTTSNNIFWLGVGPQLMAPRGPLRPYVNGTVGLSYFSTTSSVEGVDSEYEFARDENFGDAVFSWGGGAGVLVPVHRSAKYLVSIDVGARYHDNGRNVRYLREGGIRDLPNGQIELDVIRSRADLLTWHLGVSLGGR